MGRQKNQTVRNSIRAGAFFGVAVGLLYGVISGPLSGVIIGVFAGVLFGLFVGVFVFFATRKFQGIRAEMAQQMSIVYDGGANHFVGMEGVGGWLFLTDRELIFKSHNFNINRHVFTVPLADIVNIQTGKSLGLIANKLIIQTRLGTSEAFVVNNVKTWLAELQRAKGAASGSPAHQEQQV
jgi:hypothetical protein